MNSTSNSSKSTPQCPPISEALVEFLDTVFPPLTTSMGHELRDLDHQSGTREVVDYLRGQLEKQRSA